MTIHQVAQGTKAWMDLRAGIPTASRFDDIITPGGERSSSQPRYMNHLLAERIMGQPIDGFQSQAMADGNSFEDRAVAAYELENDCETERIGFVTIDDGKIGCSPDRWIVGNDKGMVEAKSPTPAIHVSYLLAATGASQKYKVQLQGQLWVCEREWVDIVAYCPGMPTVTFRVSRDEEYIKELAAHVRAFSGQLEEKAEQFRERGWIKEREIAEPQDVTGLGVSDEDLLWMKEGVHYPVGALNQETK